LADLFTDAESLRVACQSYLQIVGPFYAFVELCLFLSSSSQEARRRVWPVMGAAARLVVVVYLGV